MDTLHTSVLHFVYKNDGKLEDLRDNTTIAQCNKYLAASFRTHPSYRKLAAGAEITRYLKVKLKEVSTMTVSARLEKGNMKAWVKLDMIGPKIKHEIPYLTVETPFRFDENQCFHELYMNIHSTFVKKVPKYSEARNQKVGMLVMIKNYEGYKNQDWTSAQRVYSYSIAYVTHEPTVDPGLLDTFHSTYINAWLHSIYDSDAACTVEQIRTSTYAYYPCGNQEDRMDPSRLQSMLDQFLGRV